MTVRCFIRAIGHTKIEYYVWQTRRATGELLWEIPRAKLYWKESWLVHNSNIIGWIYLRVSRYLVHSGSHEVAASKDEPDEYNTCFVRYFFKKFYAHTRSCSCSGSSSGLWSHFKPWGTAVRWTRRVSHIQRVPTIPWNPQLNRNIRTSTFHLHTFRGTFK